MKEFWIGIVYAGGLVLSFVCGMGAVSTHTKTVTKTVPIVVPASTTTTEPWVGIQCMVNGALIKTDLAHAQEAGCQ